MGPTNLLLFGDQTVEKLSTISGLVQYSKTSPAVRRFLQEATDVVQIESSKLNPEERRGFHGFNSIQGLAEQNGKQEQPNELVATVLMCIGRLGELILHTEEDPSILGSTDSPTEVLGFCTGLIPAAAAVVARDSSELFVLSSELISVTFRLAYELNRRSKLIEKTLGSWATTIIGATVEQTQPILDNFHQSNEIPTAKHVAIGVLGTGWITLFGPPSTMERLWGWPSDLSTAPRVKTDTGGAVHTGHLPEVDMERVLGNSPILDTPIPPKARIVSTGTCRKYNAHDLRSLLREMIHDIAQNVLYITDTINEAVSNLVGNGDVVLTVVGPTGHSDAVQRALQERGITHHLIQHASSGFRKPMRGGSDDIAIVGMSGRFPGSESVQEFWEGLLDGKDYHKKIPKERFDLEKYFDPTGKAKNSMTVQHGCFLERPGMFDNKLFNVSPREATQMDAAQRLLLTTSYEALEMAGYYPDGNLSTARERIATYFGQNSDDWREVAENEGIDIFYVPGIARGFAPGKINYHFKWGGGTYSVDCACASSATTISLACSALIARECDTALAGGASILNSPNPFTGLGKGGFLSTTGGCKTFSDKADGYCRGEGIGVVVLKRLEDAVASNDNILAVIKGSARNYSTNSTSITHPSAEAQQRLYEQILQQSSTKPTDISYVEFHGTGTQAGDSEEMKSVIQTFGQNRTKENPLVAGAVKASVGHGEAVAAVTGLIKVLMMLKTERIPPQPGTPLELNRGFPALDKMNIHIAENEMGLKPSTNSSGKKRLFLNSFDATGGNSALLIEEAPKQPQKNEDPRTHHIVTVSAKTHYSLEANKRRLLHYLIQHPETNIADLAYTRTARRMHETLRSAYHASSTREIVQLITADLDRKEVIKPKGRGQKANLVFVFTGQGSHYSGMGRQLFEHNSAFRELLMTYEGLGTAQGLPSFVDLISQGELDISTKSVVEVQLAIVALEIAMAQTYRSWGVDPDVVIGHSLGEYAALCVSGVLSLSDTLYLVGSRAKLMQEKLTTSTFAMLAAGKDANTLRSHLSSNALSSCEIACFNGPDTTVVSGQVDEINELWKRLNEEGTRSTLLKVPHGFHSRQLEPILEDLETCAKGVMFSKPAIPLASTLQGRVVQDSVTFSPAYLVRQARDPVNFVEALEACRLAGLANDQTIWIEIGPEPVCLGMIRRTLDVPTLRLLPTLKSSENNWMTTSTALAAAYNAGISVNWPEYHKEYAGSLTLLDLPAYAFDEKDFWTRYSKPESEVQSKLEKTSSPGPGFSTTSLQRVDKETMDGRNISVTFASNTSNPELFSLIQGHAIDGITICPMSLFCDMALSAAEYIHSRLKANEPMPRLSLCALEITHALVVTDINSHQAVYITATGSLDSDTVGITFRSTEGDHGGCKVVFSDHDKWIAEQSQTLFLLNKRMSSLAESARHGSGHRLQKQIVYKMFENVVSYSQKYQRLEEVFLDDDFNDAVGMVKLSDAEGSGQFLNNPYWIDAIVHLAGFVLNGNLKHPKDIAFLSTGFETWRIVEQLSGQKSYTSYVCIHDSGQQSTLIGDVYVFDENKKTLASAVTGVKFQRVKKVALKSILRGSAPGSSQRAIQPDDKHSISVKKTRGGFPDKADSSVSVEIPDVMNVSRSSSEKSRMLTPPSSVDNADEFDAAALVLDAVASETGCAPDEMSLDMHFADIGVDSLMSITILAKLREEMGLELEASFFNDYPTVSDLKRRLEKETSNADVSPTSGPDAHSPVKAPDRQDDTKGATKADKNSLSRFDAGTPTPSDEKSEYSSKVIPLQGRISSTQNPLFLFCDGTGSVAGYIHLPLMASGMRVYGVESPFTNTPLKYNSIEEISEAFVRTVRKTQPKGPYILGGFSAGAVYAYEVARRLLEEGETVQKLVIMGMHAPNDSMTDKFEPTAEHIEEAGIATGINRTKTQKPKDHIRRTVQALIAYKPVPMASARRPASSFVISGKLRSRETVSSFEGSNRLIQWVAANWTASNAKGWDRLVGDVECSEVDGDGDFSLVVNQNVKPFGNAIRAVVEELEI